MRILIVDDEQDLVDTFAGFVSRKLPSATILTANCGEDALKIYNDNPCDVVLSDVRMPNGDGVFLLESIFDNTQESEKPLFIFLTGYSDTPHEVLKEKGCYAVLEKPISINTLWEKMEEALGDTL